VHSEPHEGLDFVSSIFDFSLQACVSSEEARSRLLSNST
jgi:hypothetical protein